ncbi:hypothetical protein TWF481_009331 [Arthrobotrys musiformis]|uniref:Uncharacterized protein n=1 Tax=Arthrobotrys musiformis TaxID=47236 RepID=A0AAV9W5Z3_9PEZI
MKYSPPARRFSLPAFDIFGQPMFEPYLYYSQFHPYPPPPPPPPPPHQHQHLYPHQHPHPHLQLHSHHGYQHPPEPYPYFNVPETLPEEYFIPSSPSTNPFSNSPNPNHYSISREISSSSISGNSIDYTSLSSSIFSSSPQNSLSSAPSASTSPNSFAFGIGIPPYALRTETPEERYGVEENMVVRTIPHPDTVQQEKVMAGR